MADHERTCVVCGVGWRSKEHLRALARDWTWRGWDSSLGLLYPHRVWAREQLPGSRDGCTVGMDDGALRWFDSDMDPIGHIWPMEWKGAGRSLDTPTRNALRAVADPTRLHPGVTITLDGGNTPGPLLHWPSPCPDCDLPPRLRVAHLITITTLTGQRHAFTQETLGLFRALLTNPWQLDKLQ